MWVLQFCHSTWPLGVFFKLRVWNMKIKYFCLASANLQYFRMWLFIFGNSIVEVISYDEFALEWGAPWIRSGRYACKEEERHTHTLGGQRHVKTQTHRENSMWQWKQRWEWWNWRARNSKGLWPPPGARERQGRVFPYGLRKEHSLADTLILDF